MLLTLQILLGEGVLDWSWLPALGPTAGVVVIVVIFLKYMSDEGLRSRGVMSDLISRVEKSEEFNRASLRNMSEDFSSVMAGFREESRHTVNDLLSINRETVQAMSQVTSKVGDIGVQVGILSQHVLGLKGVVDDIRHMPRDKPNPPRKNPGT